MRIGIVGAGLSGRLLALNLLRLASPGRGARVVMFDRGDEPYMGPAYSNASDRLLLNVPACRMGAYADDPEHFLRWLRDRDALPNGAIIDAAGHGSDVLYTLGSTMKGVLWEVVAVPEILVQAERLARLLLDEAPRGLSPDQVRGRL
jgi:uncharacterized NAD(P)/FAD-binding protein YdhS